MVCTKTYTLNTGYTIPAIGLGTWQGAPGKDGEDSELTKSIKYAIDECGYRHIDTAALYGTEEEVGAAIRGCSVSREELFVTTKLPSFAHHDVEAAFLKSLNDLDIGYIDLYLMHWPQAMKGEEPSATPTFSETWADMEALIAKYPGKIRTIGVSNFSEKTLAVLFANAKIIPAVNQIEVHPSLPQDQLIDFCKSHGIVVTAYSPLGQFDSPFMNDKLLTGIAEKYNVSVPRVILSWLVNGKDIVTIPKSSNPERLKQNIDLIELDKDDVDAISGFHKLKPGNHCRLCAINGHRPTGHDVVMGWTYEQLGWEEYSLPK